MIKRAAFVATIAVVVLLSGNPAWADVSVVVNGSFENDGRINDITVREPNGWDVEMPAEKFGGWVYGDWVTDGFYNLSLCSYWFTEFDVGDMAIVSQQVYLTDVNEIIFDLKLEAYPFSEPWDPSKRTAVLLIDDEVVWSSDDWVPDSNGEYRGQPADIDVDDIGLHKLSLGIRADVNEELLDVDVIYYTHWDSVGFELYCEGFGFLAGDFSRDCYVDMDDMEMFAGVWLDKIDPNDKYNLFQGDDTEPNGIINFFDFAVYADDWDYNTVDLEMFTDVWLCEVETTNEYNLFRKDEEEPNGIVNFLDFAVLAENWMDDSYE